MYFVKEVRSSSLYRAGTYFFYTECSKGKAWLEVRISCVDHNAKVPEYRRDWHWRVEMWKYKKNKNGELEKQVKCAQGFEPTLYRATQSALQRLLSQRRQPLTQLMDMLAKDQVMYELGRIGN